MLSETGLDIHMVGFTGLNRVLPAWWAYKIYCSYSETALAFAGHLD